MKRYLNSMFQLLQDRSMIKGLFLLSLIFIPLNVFGYSEYSDASIEYMEKEVSFRLIISVAVFVPTALIWYFCENNYIRVPSIIVCCISGISVAYNIFGCISYSLVVIGYPFYWILKFLFLLAICLFVGGLVILLIPTLIVAKVAPTLLDKDIHNSYLQLLIIAILIGVGYYVLQQIPYFDFSILPDWAYEEARHEALQDILESK